MGVWLKGKDPDYLLGSVFEGAEGAELGARADLGAVKGFLVSIMYIYETITHSNLHAGM